jgi:hypothetical protein
MPEDPIPARQSAQSGQPAKKTDSNPSKVRLNKHFKVLAREEEA